MNKNNQKKGSAVIDILALNSTKDLLMRMTPGERGLFLLFGYASNQVNVLWKLITIATNETPENPIEQRVSGTQTQILVRLLVLLSQKVAPDPG